MTQIIKVTLIGYISPNQLLQQQTRVCCIYVDRRLFRSTEGSFDPSPKIDSQEAGSNLN